MKRLARSTNKPISEEGVAEVVTPDGRWVKVRIKGSATLQDASVLANTTIKPGDHVLLMRSSARGKWVAIGAYSQNGSQAQSAQPTFPDAALAPPNNVTAFGGAGQVTCAWDGAPQRPDLTYYVEATTLDDINFLAAQLFKRAGSHLTIPLNPGEARQFRVRAVTELFSKSAWSAATSATATFAPWGAIPASSSDPGVAGQMAYDADYLYLCVATDTWKRIALSW